MTDLQLGLLVIGAVGVVAVIVYNRLQERSARRGTERSLASRHVDVLLEPEERREPTMGASRGASEEPAAPRPSARPVAAAPKPAAASATERAQPVSGSTLDTRIDYVVRVEGASMRAAQPRWLPFAQRYGRRAHLLQAADGALQATLQMVTRNGVVGEAELVEFRSHVEKLAGALGASAAAPETREALQAARALDAACAEVDIQIALHVLGPVEASADGQPFQVARRADGVTLLLDVPRTRDVMGSYEAMVHAARQLAAAHNGRIVDDNGKPLGEAALTAISAELQATLARFDRLGIEPGSPLALRLFA